MNSSLPPEFKNRVLLAAAQTPSMTRTQARSRAIVYSMLASIPMFIALFIAGGPRNAAGRPFVVTVVLTVGCLLLAIGATFLSSLRSRWMTGVNRGITYFLVLGMPLLYCAWIAGFHGVFEPPFERLGIRCFFLSLCSAPWPFAVMVTWRKTIEPHHPALLGAALGAVSGAWAGLMVVLFCPLSEPGHVARGHLLPFVVLIAAGSRLGARLFAVKSA